MKLKKLENNLSLSYFLYRKQIWQGNQKESSTIKFTQTSENNKFPQAFLQMFKYIPSHMKITDSYLKLAQILCHYN